MRYLLHTGLLLTLLSAVPAWATTYYVDVNLPGSDSNTGTSPSTPFRTIQRCISFVVAGDTCTVADGTYTDTDNNGVTVYINGAGSGTAANPITIKSTNPGGAIIAISNTPGSASYIGIHVTRSWYVIDGFEISGGTIGGAVSYAGVNVTDGVAGTLIKRNTIHHIGRAVCSTSVFGFAGVFALNAPNTVIDRNRIYAIGRLREGENGCANSVTNDANDHGIYIHGGSITITNNVIYDSNRGWPIQLSPGGVSNMVIANNTIDGQSPTGYPAGQVQLNGSITTGIIVNNIFSNPLSAVFRVSNFSSSGITYDYNLTDNADANLIVESQPATMTNGGHNRISASPGFVSLAANDYHLASGSSAIKIGMTIQSVTTDKDGASRLLGTAYDIGAYVGGGGSDSSPPAAPNGLTIH